MTRILFAAGILGVVGLIICDVDVGARQVASGAVTSLRTTGNLLPGTRPNVFATIQGNALNSSNGPLPGALVRLRDARFGRIVNVQTTDKLGLFVFRTLDPGSYIVELVGNNSAVIATSQLVSVNAGEVVSTVVKLPFRIPPFADLLGQSTQAAAIRTLVAAAASTGVLTSGPLDLCVSGPCQ